MNDRILLAHGGGGRLSQELIAAEILPRFGSGPLATLPDAASLTLEGCQLRFSTDSFVVHPLEFPGGNIGHLAVHGTVNDLAVAGARPLWFSLGLILEEGLPLSTLQVILDAVQHAANQCDIAIVTGDTKVVRRGQCDGIYINTAGIGVALPLFSLGRDRIRVGDRILVSGPLGDHGMAVMAVRETLPIKNGPISDTRPLHRLVAAIQPHGSLIHFMRDPTRGGLATTLNEMTWGQPFGITLRANDLPFSPSSLALAELLGLDLLHVASEGCLVLACHPDGVGAVLERWRALPEGSQAREIGTVTDQAGRVILETAIGGQRIIDIPSGELLPRIC
ncbi:MAG: hydrogenase expression/formation protein HypE [Magnetococcus sp. THC-1_WYH]